ncbi:MAG: 16S rRNA (uracil(1498)-N(3))-methyltransferase [Desulfocapsa sp.]|nr:16S rRNA (uracil(1498)-N(3))-methyltransferase [Desulfocapsa sp.]
MRRFFIPPETEISDELLLPEQESHHLIRVLRLTVGTPLQLLDGRGNIHDAEIIAVGRQVTLRILSSLHIPQDDTPLRVCQSMLKGQKMELLVQKCTELGVREFTPFYSDRCQLKKTELAKITKKHERWQRIVEEACKQCGTPWAMRLTPLFSLEEMLGQREKSVQKVLFWEEEKENSLHSHPVQKNKAGLQIVFGPEGGFPENEVNLAEKAGFQILSLGPRILKAETANIAAVSILQHLLGNM